MANRFRSMCGRFFRETANPFCGHVRSCVISFTGLAGYSWASTDWATATDRTAHDDAAMLKYALPLVPLLSQLPAEGSCRGQFRLAVSRGRCPVRAARRSALLY